MSHTQDKLNKRAQRLGCISIVDETHAELIKKIPHVLNEYWLESKHIVTRNYKWVKTAKADDATILFLDTGYIRKKRDDYDNCMCCGADIVDPDLPCGHPFCNECIYRTILSKPQTDRYQCPCCKLFCSFEFIRPSCIYSILATVFYNQKTIRNMYDLLDQVVRDKTNLFDHLMVVVYFSSVPSDKWSFGALETRVKGFAGTDSPSMYVYKIVLDRCTISYEIK
jgi:hypothetical protein